MLSPIAVSISPSLRNRQPALGSGCRSRAPAHKSTRESITYLLDIIIAQSPPILELLPGEDQALLVRWDALLILDLGLDIVDRVAGFDFEGDGFAREGFDKTV